MFSMLVPLLLLKWLWWGR